GCACGRDRGVAGLVPRTLPRQPQLDDGSAAGPVAHPDRAAVRLGDRPYDGEAEPCPTLAVAVSRRAAFETTLPLILPASRATHRYPGVTPVTPISSQQFAGPVEATTDVPGVVWVTALAISSSRASSRRSGSRLTAASSTFSRRTDASFADHWSQASATTSRS